MVSITPSHDDDLRLAALQVASEPAVRTALGFARAAVLGTAYLHEVAASVLYDHVTATTLGPSAEAAFFGTAEIIHGLGFVGLLEANAVALAGGGGFLLGMGLNASIPYLGEGRLGEDIYDLFHDSSDGSGGACFE